MQSAGDLEKNSLKTTENPNSRHKNDWYFKGFRLLKCKKKHGKYKLMEGKNLYQFTHVPKPQRKNFKVFGNLSPSGSLVKVRAYCPWHVGGQPLRPCWLQSGTLLSPGEGGGGSPTHPGEPPREGPTFSGVNFGSNLTQIFLVQKGQKMPNPCLRRRTHKDLGASPPGVSSGSTCPPALGSNIYG